jgi:predicted amidohydrolase YtcJ
VYTVNVRFDIVQAFSVEDGKIVAVGTDSEIYKKYKAKETVDAKGQAVYPGFIDANAHFLGYVQSLFILCFHQVRSHKRHDDMGSQSMLLEKEVGSIEAGKQAGFIIRDKDLMKVGETDVSKTKVVATYTGGKRSFEDIVAAN